MTSVVTISGGYSNIVRTINDGTYLYFVSNVTLIVRYNILTQATTSIQSISVNGYASQICTDGTYIYYYCTDASIRQYIGRCKTDGTSNNTTWYSIGTTGGGANPGLLTDKTYIYVYFNPKVYKILISTASLATTFMSTPFGNGGIYEIYNGIIYGTNGNVLYTLDTSTGSSVSTGISFPNYCFSLSTDGNYLYCTLINASPKIILVDIRPGSATLNTIINSDFVPAYNSQLVNAYTATILNNTYYNVLNSGTKLFITPIIQFTLYPSIGLTVQTVGAPPVLDMTSYYKLSTLAFNDSSNVCIINFDQKTTPFMGVLVAGGGGGGYAQGTYEGGGGGGGGEVVVMMNPVFNVNQSYTVTVGQGGSGGVSATTSATNGNNTILSGNYTIKAMGGGFGSSSTGTVNQTPGTGGSGGGSNGWYGAGINPPPGGTSNAPNVYGTSSYMIYNGVNSFSLSSTQTLNNLFMTGMAITDDGTRMVISIKSDLTNAIVYTKWNGSSWGALTGVPGSNNIVSTTGGYAGQVYVSMTPDGNTIFVSCWGGFCYYSKWNGTSYGTLVKTLAGSGNYMGSAITADGNRAVVNIFSSNMFGVCSWNGTNYSTFTNSFSSTSITVSQFTHPILSRDGNRLVFGVDTSGMYFLALWNGTNYGVPFQTLNTTARTYCRIGTFSYDANILLVTVAGNLTGTLWYATWTGSNYTAFTPVSTSIIPANLELYGVGMTYPGNVIYTLGYNSTNLYVVNGNFNTSIVSSSVVPYGNFGGVGSFSGAGGGGGGATSAGFNNTTSPNPGGIGGAGGGSYTVSYIGNTIGNYGGGGGGGGVGSTYTVSLYGAGGGTNCGGAGGSYNSNAVAGRENTGGGGGGGGGGNGTFPSGLNGAVGGSGTFILVFRDNPCFRIDTKILTNRGYRKIQHLRKGDLVKTVKHGFVPIDMIGTSEIHHHVDTDDTKHNQKRLYRLSREKYPELFEDLVITGCHSILVDEFSGNERSETQRVLGDIYLTDNFYRLPACVDRRTKLYEVEGTHRIYHIALENKDYYMNYGIYANGLLVESCCRRYLKEFSNMRLMK